MKVLLFLFFSFVFTIHSTAADSVQVCSPSGRICVKLWMDENLRYAVYKEGNAIVRLGEINLELTSGKLFSQHVAIRSHLTKNISTSITALIPEKRKIIPDIYNQLTLTFSQPYVIEIRAYDDGIAYRFLTAFPDSITVVQETARFGFPVQTRVYFPAVQKRTDVDIFHTSFEEPYINSKLTDIPTGELAFSPVVLQLSTGETIGLTESDLEDYPGMFLAGSGTDQLNGTFAPFPIEEKLTEGEFPESVVTRRAKYIARTKGRRSFPWRVMIIAREDRELPSNDLVYRLASPSRIGNASWVHPGKGTDEWIIHVNLFNVPFRSGVNTASYKFYIDFAKRFGFDRIMMDAGWSENKDLFKINPDIDVDTLVAYAKQQGIKISMWTLANTLDRQLDSALDRFNRWGVDYIMTDFIDRDDQKTVNFYHRIAKACADHQIMIMFHGAFPPKGFSRTYPNNITRESVLGSEYNIWSDKATPGHDLTLPFTRMLSGSFDYEPGILNNSTKNGFRPVEGMVMSQGTRCHQLAMFVVYDNPMPIFSGNPSQGLLEPKFMELMGSLPTTWDETHILEGKIGEYILTARKKDNDWYIGGMTNWTPRDFTIRLDFLNQPSTYQATLCRDGVNADSYAADYILEERIVKRDSVLQIHLAPGGGFLLRMKEEQ